ncbi:PLDc N-terminal domain-containing protein [Corynebacterium sp. H127]
MLSGPSLLEYQPVDYFYLALSVAALILLVVAMVHYFRQEPKSWSAVLVLLVIFLLPLVGPIAYIYSVRRRS